MVNYSQDFPFSWEIYLFSLSNIYNGQFNKNLNWKFIIILPWLANWPCFARSPPTSSPAMKPRTVPNKTRRLTHTRKQDRLPDFPRSSDIITLSLDKHKCHFYIKTVPTMNLSFNCPSQPPSRLTLVSWCPSCHSSPSDWLLAHCPLPRCLWSSPALPGSSTVLSPTRVLTLNTGLSSNTRHRGHQRLSHKHRKQALQWYW